MGRRTTPDAETNENLSYVERSLTTLVQALTGDDEAQRQKALSLLLPWQERSSQIMGGSILNTGVLEVTHDVAGQVEQLQQKGMNAVGQLISVIGQT